MLCEEGHLRKRRYIFLYQAAQIWKKALRTMYYKVIMFKYKTNHELPELLSSIWVPPPQCFPPYFFLLSYFKNWTVTNFESRSVDRNAAQLIQIGTIQFYSYLHTSTYLVVTFKNETEGTAFLKIHPLSPCLPFQVDSDGLQDSGLSIHFI